MDKLTSCSTLVTPAIASLVQSFGQEKGVEFKDYIQPGISSIAIAHICGREVNGIVTIDINHSEKSVLIGLTSGDDLSKDEKISLVKFAVLKSINIGMKSACILGASEIMSEFEDSDFGAIRTSKSGTKAFEFYELPHASLSSYMLYSVAGLSCGAFAMGSLLSHSLFDVLHFATHFGYANPALAYASASFKKAA